MPVSQAESVSKSTVAEDDEQFAFIFDNFSVEIFFRPVRRVSLALLASPYAILFVAVGDKNSQSK